MAENKKRRLKKWKILVGIVLFLIVAYPIVGFLVIPPIARSVAVKQASKATGREVAIEKIRLNPYLLTLAVEGFSMREADGKETFASVGLLRVDLGWASLFCLAPVVQEVRVERPFVRVERESDGSFNFSTIGPMEKPAVTSEASPTTHSLAVSSTEVLDGSADHVDDVASTSQTARKLNLRIPVLSTGPLSVSNIQILDGSADYVDDVVSTSHTVRKLNLRIPVLSNMGEQAVRRFTEPHFSARVDGKPLELEGKTKPFANSLETTVEFGVEGLDLPEYYAYVPPVADVDLTSGALDLKVRVSYLQHRDGRADLGVSGRLAVRGIEVLDGERHPLFRLGALEVDLLRSSLLGGNIHVGRVAIRSPHIGLARRGDGVLNVYRLMRPAVAAATDATDASAAPQAPPSAPVATSSDPTSISITLDAFEIDDLRVMLRDVATTSGTQKDGLGDTLFALSSFAVRDTKVDMVKSRATVGSVSVGPGNVEIDRLADGLLNVEALAPPSDGTTSASEEVVAASSESPPAEAGSLWIAAVDRIGLTSFTVAARSLVDAGRGDVTLELARLEVADFSTEAGAKGRAKIDLRINRSGRIDVGGTFGLAPVSADLALGVEGIELPWGQPFIDDQLNAAIVSGTFGTSLSVAFQTAESGEMAASVAGAMGIADFALRDKRSMEDLVRWDALRVSGIDAGNAPTRARIGGILLDGLVAFPTLEKDGALNFAQIAVADDGASSATEVAAPAEEKKPEPQPTPEAKTESAEAAPEIRIGGIEIRRSRIAFADRSMSPPYKLGVRDIEVKLGEMSNRETKPTDVSVRAKLQESTDLTISGSVAPLAEKLFVDMGVRLDGLELSPASTYSGRYAGYEIGSGKLLVDLKYHIDGPVLNSKNRVVLDQLTFGDKVKSRDAVRLPLKLALAILKDRHGKITVDVPIEGRLDDPEFRFWGTVARTLMGLVTKAATSPFSALASLVGSDQDLRQIAFAPGSADIDAAAKEKLDLLAKALYERPGLQLDISGFADTEADRKAVADARFERLLKVEKARDMAKRGDAPLSPDEVKIAPEEREKYLKEAYKAATFEKPTNALGMLASQPPGTMETMLRGHIEVTDDDLGDLAKRRAQKTQAYIVESGKIEATRLFLVKRAPLAPEDMEGVSASRVELGVR